MGTGTVRYLSHRSFGSDCDHWGITVDCGDLETGTHKHCFIKKEYHREPQHLQVSPKG